MARTSSSRYTRPICFGSGNRESGAPSTAASSLICAGRPPCYSIFPAERARALPDKFEISLSGRLQRNVWNHNTRPLFGAWRVLALGEFLMPRPTFDMTERSGGGGADQHARSLSAYRAMRAETERRAAPLSAEDQAI